MAQSIAIDFFSQLKHRQVRFGPINDSSVKRASKSATGVAQADRNLVTDQLAAAVGEDRRTAHPTCALLLVVVGRGASEPEAVRRHAAEDRGAAGASGIGTPQSAVDFGDEKGRKGTSV